MFVFSALVSYKNQHKIQFVVTLYLNSTNHSSPSFIFSGPSPGSGKSSLGVSISSFPVTFSSEPQEGAPATSCCFVLKDLKSHWFCLSPGQAHTPLLTTPPSHRKHWLPIEGSFGFLGGFFSLSCTSKLFTSLIFTLSPDRVILFHFIFILLITKIHIY